MDFNNVEFNRAAFQTIVYKLRDTQLSFTDSASTFLALNASVEARVAWSTDVRQKWNEIYEDLKPRTRVRNITPYEKTS